MQMISASNQSFTHSTWISYVDDVAVENENDHPVVPILRVVSDEDGENSTIFGYYEPTSEFALYQKQNIKLFNDKSQVMEAEVHSMLNGIASHLVTSGVSLGPGVSDFCYKNDLVRPLFDAIRLTKQHFSNTVSYRTYMDVDVEDGTEYVVLEVNSTGNPNEDTNSLFGYSEEWSELIEWPASRMIVLDLNSVD